MHYFSLYLNCYTYIDVRNTNCKPRCYRKILSEIISRSNPDSEIEFIEYGLRNFIIITLCTA